MIWASLIKWKQVMWYKVSNIKKIESKKGKIKYDLIDIKI